MRKSNNTKRKSSKEKITTKNDLQKRSTKKLQQKDILYYIAVYKTGKEVTAWRRRQQ